MTETYRVSVTFLFGMLDDWKSPSDKQKILSKNVMICALEVRHNKIADSAKNTMDVFILVY